MECIGLCYTHKGKVRNVMVVSDSGASVIPYCEAAIESDRSKGFIAIEQPSPNLAVLLIGSVKLIALIAYTFLRKATR